MSTRQRKPNRGGRPATIGHRKLMRQFQTGDIDPATMRQLGTLMRDIAVDDGGFRQQSHRRHFVTRRAAMLEMLCSSIEAHFLRHGVLNAAGEPFAALKLYLAATNTLKRYYELLGIDRQPGGVLSLGEYVAKNHNGAAAHGPASTRPNPSPDAAAHVSEAVAQREEHS